MRSEFLFAAIPGRTGRVAVLNGAGGAAKQYRSPLLAVDFAKAAIANWVAANEALVRPRFAESRFTWFTVMGGVHRPVLSCGAMLALGWGLDDDSLVRRSFCAGWLCQASAYSTLRTTTVIIRSGCIGFTGKGVGFSPEWLPCLRCRRCAGTDFQRQNRAGWGLIEFRRKG